MVNGLNFFSHTFPQKQLLPSEVSFFVHTYNILFKLILAIACVVIPLHSVAALAEFMTIEICSSYCARTLYLFVYMSEIWWPDVWHTFNKWNAFLPQPSASPLSSLSAHWSIKICSFFLSKSGCKLCNFKEIKNILAPHAH